jgi:hypothetical protein
LKVHRNWIICEIYTPNGVVVVEDVVPTKGTTVAMAVIEEVYFPLLNIIFSNVTFFSYQKNWKRIFMNITILQYFSFAYLFFDELI